MNISIHEADWSSSYDTHIPHQSTSHLSSAPRFQPPVTVYPGKLR